VPDETEFDPALRLRRPPRGVRRDGETSLMAKGIFGHAANESKARAGD